MFSFSNNVFYSVQRQIQPFKTDLIYKEIRIFAVWYRVNFMILELSIILWYIKAGEGGWTAGMGRWVGSELSFLLSNLILYNWWVLILVSVNRWQRSPGFYVFAVQVFWKHCGKRRNRSKRAISPFPTVFSTLLIHFLLFSSSLKLSFANSFSLEESKICRLGNG